MRISDWSSDVCSSDLDGLKAPDTNTVWAARGDKLTPSTPVTLRWNNGQGQIFEIKLAIDQDYMFTVTQKVTNTGKGAAAVRPYGYISHKGVSADPSSWTIQDRKRVVEGKSVSVRGDQGGRRRNKKKNRARADSEKETKG